MSGVERSIEIKAPPEKIWEMLAIDSWSEWMDGWKNAEYTSEVRKPKDKYKVGALAHITELNTRYDFEITESLENEKIAFLSKGKGVGRLTMTITYIWNLQRWGLNSLMRWIMNRHGGFLAKPSAN